MQPRTIHHAQRGMATVELALLLPVVLLLLFSLVDYGRFFYLRSMAASVAQDAVGGQPARSHRCRRHRSRDRHPQQRPTDTPPGYSLGSTRP
jgi:hypothetical protein